MYTEARENEPMLGPGEKWTGTNAVSAPNEDTVRTMQMDKPPQKCNDAIFALLFLLNIASIAVLAFWLGIPALKSHVRGVGEEPSAESDYTMVFVLSAVLVGAGVVISMAWMRLLMAFASTMIQVALWLNVALTTIFAIASFLANPVAGVLFLAFAAINVCYIYLVQRRIAFATANLQAACAAVSEHSSIFGVALLLVVKQTVWLMLWSLAFLGVYNSLQANDPECQKGFNTPRYGRDGRLEGHMCGGTAGGTAVFFLLISVYWGQQVLQNVLTCTTAGVVATWWYQPNAQKTTFGALYRSMTTSFGSICLGSLLVAILSALRTMANVLKEQAREDENTALACVACMAECILNCLEGIMEYFNSFAYVYVGIYGFDFRTSGKAVMELFRNRGWTAVINDDLTSSALSFGALGVGVATCCTGLLIARFGNTDWFTAFRSAEAPYALLGTIGFIAGFSMAMILARVVVTALHTVFVCFAEDPVSLNRNHPEKYERLVSGWREFHGEALVSAYGSAV